MSHYTLRALQACPVDFQWNAHTRTRAAAPFPHSDQSGRYPLYYVCACGDILCAECANTEARASITLDTDDDWRLVAQRPNYEDTDLWCDACMKRIPAAYDDNNDDKQESN